MRTTLWQAIDRDQRFGRIWRSLDVRSHRMLLALLLVPVLWSACLQVVVVRQYGAAPRDMLLPAALTLGYVIAVILLGVLKYHSAPSSQGVWLAQPFLVVPVATRSALQAVSLASGLPDMLDIHRMTATGINAVTFEIAGSRSLAVTDGFAALPVDEQAAGIAMMLSRRRNSPVVTRYEGFEPVDGWNPDNFEMQQRVYDAWTEYATAGDRQALLLLKDPGPFVRLLTRLARSQSEVSPPPQLREGFACLAWPFSVPGVGSGDASLADRRRLDHLCGVLADGPRVRQTALSSSRRA